MTNSLETTLKGQFIVKVSVSCRSVVKPTYSTIDTEKFICYGTPIYEGFTSVSSYSIKKTLLIGSMPFTKVGLVVLALIVNTFSPQRPVELESSILSLKAGIWSAVVSPSVHMKSLVV